MSEKWTDDEIARAEKILVLLDKAVGDERTGTMLNALAGASFRYRLVLWGIVNHAGDDAVDVLEKVEKAARAVLSDAPAMGQPFEIASTMGAELGDFLVRTREQMTDEERLAIFDALMVQWCKHCGRYDPPGPGRGCQCWNDE